MLYHQIAGAFREPKDRLTIALSVNLRKSHGEMWHQAMLFGADLKIESCHSPSAPQLSLLSPLWSAPDLAEVE